MKTLTNFEKIKLLIDCGHWVKGKDSIGKDYLICGYSGSTFYGNFFDATHFDECSVNALKTIQAIPRNPAILPVGTKVRIDEIARESEYFQEWDKGAKDMVGEIKVITGIMNRQGQYNVDGYNIPRLCVVPVLEDETKTVDELTDEELIALVEERGLVKQGKILR